MAKRIVSKTKLKKSPKQPPKPKAPTDADLHYLNDHLKRIKIQLDALYTLAERIEDCAHCGHGREEGFAVGTFLSSISKELGRIIDTLEGVPDAS